MIDNVYNDRIREILRTKAPWPGLIINVRSYEEFPGLLVLQCEQENFYSFSERKRQDLSVHVSILRDRIRNLGLQCEMELA